MLAVVGNKCDCPSTFDFTQAQQFAKEIGATVFRTSAKTGDGVSTLFDTVGEQLLKKHDEEERNREREQSVMGTNTHGRRGGGDGVLHVVDASQREEKKNKGCC